MQRAATKVYGTGDPGDGHPQELSDNAKVKAESSFEAGNARSVDDGLLMNREGDDDAGKDRERGCTPSSTHEELHGLNESVFPNDGANRRVGSDGEDCVNSRQESTMHALKCQRSSRSQVQRMRSAPNVVN